jgi:drug/metabolite transporter (DMT)-like permease
MNKRIVVILAVILAGVIAGSAAGITKKGLEEIPPYSFSFLRFVVASLCVLPLFLKLKKNSTSQLGKLTKFSLFATLNILFFVIGLNITTANIGVIVYAAVPLMVVAILFLFFKERLSRLKELGVIIGFVGVLLITFLPVLEKGNPFAGNLWGNILLILAVIFWSLYMVYSKKLQEKYSLFLITCNFIFVSTFAFFPLFIWDIFAYYGWWEQLSAWGIFSVVYMAVVITVMNYMLTQYTIKHGGAAFSSMMFYIQPIVGFGINFLLLGELLTPGFIFGSLLALVGTYLVVRK